MTDSTTAIDTQLAPRCRRWILGNAWNLLGTLLGIVGLVSGYAFYRAALPVPSLTFVSDANHQLILNYGSLSTSAVRIIRADGKPVTQNVYGASVFIWNSGNVAFRKISILSPLSVSASNVEILDAKIVRTSRPEITKVRADTDARSGVIDVSFDILEPGDGCRIDLLYAAPVTTPFRLTGAIEGVKGFSLTDRNVAGDIVLKTTWGVVKRILIFALFLLVLFLVNRVDRWTKKKPAPLVSKITKYTFSTIGMLILAGMVLAFLNGVFVDATKEAEGEPRDSIPAALMR